MSRISITIQIDADTPEVAADLQARLLRAYHAEGHVAVAAPGTDEVQVLHKEDPEAPPPSSKKGRPRKPSTPAGEASPAATSKTTPQDMLNEAARMLGVKYGTSNPGKEFKALLAEFDAPSVPDVAEDQAADFLARVKALCSDADVKPLPAPVQGETPTPPPGDAELDLV